MADALSDEGFLLGVLTSTPVIDGVPADDFADADRGRAWLAGAGVAISVRPGLRALRCRHTTNPHTGLSWLPQQSSTKHLTCQCRDNG